MTKGQVRFYLWYVIALAASAVSLKHFYCNEDMRWSATMTILCYIAAMVSR